MDDIVTLYGKYPKSIHYVWDHILIHMYIYIHTLWGHKHKTAICEYNQQSYTQCDDTWDIADATHNSGYQGFATIIGN